MGGTFDRKQFPNLDQVLDHIREQFGIGYSMGLYQMEATVKLIDVNPIVWESTIYIGSSYVLGVL